MIWLAERNLLFVHNPKCAGTSVHKALMDTFPNAATCWGRRYEAAQDRIRDMAHMSVGEGRAHFGIAAPFRSFGFVRDPYSRFVSSYRHFKHWNRDHVKLTPEALVLDILDEERIRFDWKFIHFAPQYRFFYEGPVRGVSRIWKVESLPSAWEDVRREFSLSMDLPRENRLETGESTHLSEEVIARLNLLYARDFALFDYPLLPVRGVDAKPRGFYAKFKALWPEYRGLDTSDRTMV